MSTHPLYEFGLLAQGGGLKIRYKNDPWALLEDLRVWAGLLERLPEEVHRRENYIQKDTHGIYQVCAYGALPFIHPQTGPIDQLFEDVPEDWGDPSDLIRTVSDSAVLVEKALRTALYDWGLGMSVSKAELIGILPNRAEQFSDMENINIGIITLNDGYKLPFSELAQVIHHIADKLEDKLEDK